MSRGRPVLIRLEASRPARAQCAHPPLMGFCSPSAFRIARSDRSSLDERAGFPLPADSVSAVSTTLTSSSACDLADHLTMFRSTLGVLCSAAVLFERKRRASSRDDLPERHSRCRVLDLHCYLHTFARRDLGVRIASSRVLATNAVPFAQASPSNSIVLSIAGPTPADRTNHTTSLQPLQGLSPPGAADIRPPPPACFAVFSSATACARSTHRALGNRRHNGAPRSIHAPTGWPNRSLTTPS